MCKKNCTCRYFSYSSDKTCERERERVLCFSADKNNHSTLLPKRPLKIHALLFYKVNDATHIPLQAHGDVHKSCVLVQFGSVKKV